MDSESGDYVEAQVTSASEVIIDGVVYQKKSDMVDEIQSDDPRRELVALRDYLVHELDGHRCNKCQMSQLKTGDTAALVLRLQKVMEEIRTIPKPVADGEQPNVVKINASKTERMAKIREEQAMKSVAAENRRDNPGRRSGGRR